MTRPSLLACASLLLACGDPPRDTGDTASGTGGATTTTTTATTASTGPGDSTGGSGSATSSPTTGDPTTTTDDPGTTTTTTTTTASTGPATTGTSTGSDTEFVCDPNAVPDTLAFNYVKTYDIGLADVQASYYNIEAQELVFLSWKGAGKRVALDGTVLGDVAVPPEVANITDGATYDQVNKIALIVDQGCNFAEVDPVTLALLSSTKLDAKFGLDICSGLAIGLDGNLYITSTNTEEVVVITRDLTTEVLRFKVDDDGLTNVDGISLIAGSENFLVLSTYDLKAAIVSPTGDIVVPTSTIGGQAAPLIGGDAPVIPDAVLTVCGNGHAWICEGLQQNKVGCYEYAPEGGDSDSCPCVLPG